jgi:hypothetical protein
LGEAAKIDERQAMDEADRAFDYPGCEGGQRGKADRAERDAGAEEEERGVGASNGLRRATAIL